MTGRMPIFQLGGEPASQLTVDQHYRTPFQAGIVCAGVTPFRQPTKTPNAKGLKCDSSLDCFRSGR